MFLKSLSLKGFKSFADKTVMTFDPNLNVVVGPNGSGKSNVSDSILWVLGEQSAKNLRGQAMEDVIFSGSSARGAVGVAEVTLVLDNSDNSLPIDFEEVAITRRMYRSGESEYLINASPCRLMDIQDILHDTGLGKDTHSIISQGGLEQVLQSRPEERRALVEEAAGISKHRRRKERSLRKLKGMEANLVRAKDIEHEIVRQLRPLERQANKAQRHSELTARLSELTLVMAVDDLRRLQEQWNALENKQNEADAACDLARYKLEERKAELERLQLILEEKGLFVGDLTEQRARTGELASRLDATIRLLEEKSRNMKRSHEEAQRVFRSVGHQRRDVIEEQQRTESERREAKSSEEGLRKLVEELEPQAAAARTSRSDIDQELAKRTAELRTSQREADAATLALAKLKDEISNAEVEDAMFESRLTQIEESLLTAQEALSSCIERQDRASSELELSKTRAAEIQQAIDKHKQTEQKALTQREEIREQLADARANLSSLVAVDSASDQASPMVAQLLEDEQAQNLVECRLSDLIVAPPELEGLVERLLGDSLATLIVADKDSLTTLAQSASELQELGGKASMMSRQPLASQSTQKASLLERIEYSEEARTVVEALLGAVELTESIDEALEAYGRDARLCYASLDGSIVYPDGRVVYGQQSFAEAGSLERKRSIRELKAQVPALEEGLSLRASELEAAQKALAQAQADSAELSATIARLEAELSSAKSEQGRLEAQIASAQSEKDSVAKRRAQANSKVEEAKPQLSDHKRKADEANARSDELSGRLRSLSDERVQAAQNERELDERLSEARLKLATVSERRRHLDIRGEELTNRLRGLERRREFAERDSLSLEYKLSQAEPLMRRLESLKQPLDTLTNRLRDQSSIAEADSDSLKTTISEARAQVENANRSLDEAVSAAGELKLSRGRLEVQVEEAVNAITACGVAVETAVELPVLEDRSEVEAELADLKHKLDRMGPVNHVAMEEYTRLKERSDYISEQVADLEAARSSLAKITAAIDRKMRRRFLEAFEKINENFQTIYGLLVPGGNAHIEMVDPDHPMDTGIEVVAQPRGKRIVKMSLMSGGEKSLTALALLFAVYRTRTVPFYVFDEVEAALDDANLSKLLDAIEALKEETQLIVISHQRRTMEQADVLYGVSMQADGVSHVVSQRLDRESGKVVDA
ncbi:MAG: chromosome segregation protein SMC [Atopobiaceae bacterium]|nr:chromosome segregation protein SMC [Atopobiaceae bacterium]